MVDFIHRCLAACFFDATGDGAFLSATGFLTLFTKNGPADFTLTTDPLLDDPLLAFSQGALSIDGLPVLWAMIPVTPGVIRVILTHVDGTPAPALFSLIVVNNPLSLNPVK